MNAHDTVYAELDRLEPNVKRTLLQTVWTNYFEADSELRAWVLRRSATHGVADELRAADARWRLRDKVKLRGNVHLIGCKSNGLVTIMAPPAQLSKENALEFAARVVAMAMPDDGEFEQVLDAVRNT